MYPCSANVIRGVLVWPFDRHLGRQNCQRYWCHKGAGSRGGQPQQYSKVSD